MQPEREAPVSVRIRLNYPDLDSFLRHYSANISQGGIFIPSRTPPAVDTVLKFELVLIDDTLLLKGEGRVVWIKEYIPVKPQQPHGMGIRFLHLDDESQNLVNQVLEFKHSGTPPHVVRCQRTFTEEVRALVDHVQPVEHGEPEDLGNEPTDPGFTSKDPVPKNAPNPANIARSILQKHEEKLGPYGIRQSEARALAVALDSAGDDISVLLSTSEQLLKDLETDSHLSEERVKEVYESTLASSVDPAEFAATEVPPEDEDAPTIEWTPPETDPQQSDEEEVIPLTLDADLLIEVVDQENDWEENEQAPNDESYTEMDTDPAVQAPAMQLAENGLCEKQGSPEDDDDEERTDEIPGQLDPTEENKTGKKGFLRRFFVREKGKKEKE
ncbi:MAG: TIGR02266 family protein [Pseudomonadota bacterium]